MKLGISSTGLSPHVDFEIRKIFHIPKNSKTVRIFHLKFCRYHKILIPRFSILAPYMLPTLVHGLFEKNIPNFLFFKIHVRRAAGRGYSYFHLYIYVCICVFMFVRPPGQMKKDRDLKFCTHTPLDHI